MANHLVNETSPYLLQHAHNPVDWYPWGDEPFALAKAGDRPIFLSIGYSACHWCHVMAHESFEDPKVAKLLNEHFVSIKVDREERPDLDQVYMKAVQTLTGSGGWPMSVFLTPEGKPFFGGTYFPPIARYGMRSFKDVLQAVIEAWDSRREDVERSVEQVLQAITADVTAQPDPAQGELTRETLSSAVATLASSYDRAYGGWGKAPKFPQPMAIEFLLRYYRATGDEETLRMATETLKAMARGGMYDQIGGGFHRYSVDAHWLVPHFEKMLYDNAQLARAYLHAWQLTGDALFRAITEEILDYVMREMTDPSGGFYATQDADSEGKEGSFYLWSRAEVRTVLEDQAHAFETIYGITARGNSEGKNIVTFGGSYEDREALASARRKLFAARERRTHPGRDEKVLTSWNGLMLAAFAEASWALGRTDYLEAAERNANFILQESMRVDRLWHSWQGGEAKINGYLEDYAFVVDGLLALYQATFETRWFVAAQALSEAMLTHFKASHGFFDTSDDHEALISRPRQLQDNATPSGNAMAVMGLLHLAELVLETRYTEIAWDTLRHLQPLWAKYPLGFSQWLVAATDALFPHYEIAIVGEPNAPDTQALLNVCRTGYRPHQIVAVGMAGAGPHAIPLLQEREQVGEQATAYVCTGSTCLTPTTDPGTLQELLD